MAKLRLCSLVASLLFLIGVLETAALATTPANSKAYAGVESLDNPSPTQHGYFHNNNHYVHSLITAIRKQEEFPSRWIAQLTAALPFLLLYLLLNQRLFRAQIHEQQNSILFPFHTFW